MPKFKAKGTKALKIIHFLFICLWVGGALSLLLLSFFHRPTGGDELYSKLSSMKLIDDFVIIPGAMGNLIVGLIYGWWTKWGFFKHRWITIKWILTVTQILFGTFFLGPWLNSCADIARTERLDALQNSLFQSHYSLNAFFGIIQATLLIVMIWISVQKPWRPSKSQVDS